jgi:hypothetical protein
MQVGGTATIGETAEKMLSKSVLLSDTFWATHSRAAANGVTDATEKGGVVACTEGPGPVASVTMLMLTCSCGPGHLDYVAVMRLMTGLLAAGPAWNCRETAAGRRLK